MNNTVLAEDDPPRRIVFDNTEHEVLNLDIEKKVTSIDPLHPAPKDAIFTFRVQLSDTGEEGSWKNAKDKNYKIFNENGFEVFKYIKKSDGSEEYWTEKEYNARSDKSAYDNEGLTTGSTGIVKLKGGWKASVEDLDDGVNYRVSEMLPDDTDEGTWDKVLPVDEYESGKITTDENLAYFENSWSPVVPPTGGYTDLYVVKRINKISGFESPENAEFTFMIKVSGKPYANESYYEIDGEIKTHKKTDENGEFTIKGDQKAYFTGLTEKDEFAVYEKKTDGWWCVDTDSRTSDLADYDVMQSGATGVDRSVTFINSNVNFIVTKTVVDNDGNPLTSPDDTSFTFTLRDKDGVAVSDAAYYIINRDGTFSSKMTTGTDGTFSFKSGEKAQFVGIPVGTEFTVTEEAEEGYQLIEPVGGTPENGYKSEIKNGGEIFSFKNKQVDKEGELQVLKKVAYPDGIVPDDADSVKFKFLIEESYDGTTWSAKGDAYYVTYVGGVETPLHTKSDGTFELTANQSAIFTRLIIDNYYRVTELDLPDGYSIDGAVKVQEDLLTDTSSMHFTFTNVYHKLYDLNVLKVNASAANPKPVLAGAEFRVYEDAECATEINGGVGSVLTYDSVSESYHIKDLTEGTYYIKETVAPLGYELNNHVYKVEIKFELVDDKYEDNVYVDGTKVTLTTADGTGSPYVEKSKEANNAIYLEIPDVPVQPDPPIPFTGVTWWPALVLILAGVAVMAYGIKYRKNEE